MKSRHINTASAWLLFALMLASAASGQIISGNTIIGKVRNSAGKPISNVIVELHTGNGMMFTQTVSNNEGDFAFSGLEAATFVVVINDSFHQPFSERVEFARMAAGRPGETARLDVTLTPKSQASEPRAGVVFQQSVPDTALQSYRRGVKLIAERKSDEGMAALGDAIKIFPQYFDAHFALAIELFRLRRYDDTIKELEQARAINPKDSRVYKTFGLVLFEQKKYAMAATVLEAAARLNPADAEPRLIRGAALIEMGQLKEAEGEINRADQMSGRKLAVVHLHLARIYEKNGERARAANELEQYLKAAPDDKRADAIRGAIKTLRSAKSENKP